MSAQGSVIGLKIQDRYVFTVIVPTGMGLGKRLQRIRALVWTSDLFFKQFKDTLL